MWEKFKINTVTCIYDILLIKPSHVKMMPVGEYFILPWHNFQMPFGMCSRTLQRGETTFYFYTQIELIALRI